jgi:antitoxin YefM
MDNTATLDISEARKQFSKLDKRLKEERLIWVTRHNKKAFAIVDMELMEAVLETLEILQDPNALRMLQESFADIHAGRLHEHEAIEKELM